MSDNPLTASTERMNELLGRAERIFSSWKLGVAAEVEISSHGEKRRYIRFAKHSNAWILLYRTDPPSDSNQKEIPLRSTSRAVRILSLKYLPLLAQALITEAEQQAKSIEQITKSANQFLDDLENSINPSSKGKDS